VTTLLARRAQHHQTDMSVHLNPSNPTFSSMISSMTKSLEAKGFSPIDATHRAYAILQNNLFRQANMLAYIDCFWLLGAAILCMIPVVFLMKKAQPGGEIAVH
jgi:DHA2 family multidrug resistance protein